MPATGGYGVAMTNKEYQTKWKGFNEKDVFKHLCAKHDGELREVSGSWSATGDLAITDIENDPTLWHNSFALNRRQHLAMR